MINTSDREQAIKLIDEAVAAGARQERACRELGLQVRTLQRWRQRPQDGRPTAARPRPANKLDEDEREAVLAAINRPDCASLTPHQIVPKLADEGVYLASESTFYRLMRADGQARRRGRSRAPRKRPLTTHKACGPNEVWCWDITWMPSTVKGRFYYWYMVKDIYSRKVVASEVHEIEAAHHASRLLERACLAERTAGKPLVLHSDNGAAMKGATMLYTMRTLGVVPSFSRPRVSNDNAFAEALFRTAKYCPMWPERPFDGLQHAREWVMRFVHWYNEENLHGSLQYVTPAHRHDRADPLILQSRRTVYEQARQRRPERWSGACRSWTLPEFVYLNPERET